MVWSDVASCQCCVIFVFSQSSVFHSCFAGVGSTKLWWVPRASERCWEYLGLVAYAWPVGWNTVQTSACYSARFHVSCHVIIVLQSKIFDMCTYIACIVLYVLLSVFQRCAGGRGLCRNERCHESTRWWPGKNQPCLSRRSCDRPFRSSRPHTQVNSHSIHMPQLSTKFLFPFCCFLKI